jgi:hypothetical protein
MMRAALASSVLVVIAATLAFAVTVTSAGCGTSSEAESRSGETAGAATTCRAGAAAECTLPSPSYGSDVAPILERDCNQPCHAPGLGPWPLTNYSDVHDWATAVLSDVANCTMPPPDAGTVMSAADQATIVDWLACGGANN